MSTSKPGTDAKFLEKLDGETTQTHADQTILFLNSAIEKNIKSYLPSNGPISIRFDIPDKADPPDEPMLYVFLYDIQEDLELRQGQLRLYDASTGKFNPGSVHVRCCYLITYWESNRLADRSMGPRSQSMLVMNLVLNSLLNLELELLDGNRSKINVPIFKRVIAPNEHLSSLGNFWQSLGDKPRLCLNFAVTVPVSLNAPTENVAPITSFTEEVVALDETNGASSPAEQVAMQLRKQLVAALQAAQPTKQELRARLDFEREAMLLRAQLDSLNITCSLGDKGRLATSTSPVSGPWDVQVSGYLLHSLENVAKQTLTGWAQTELDGKVQIGTVKKDDLVVLAPVAPRS